MSKRRGSTPLRKKPSRKEGHKITRSVEEEIPPTRRSFRLIQMAAVEKNRDHPVYTPAGFISQDINQNISRYLSDTEVVNLRGVGKDFAKSPAFLLADDLETETALSQDAYFRNLWRNEIQGEKYYYTVPEAKAGSKIYKFPKSKVSDDRGEPPGTWNAGGKWNVRAIQEVPVRFKKVKYNDCEYPVYDFPYDVPSFEKSATTNPYVTFPGWIAHIERYYGGINFWGEDGQGGQIGVEMDNVYKSLQEEFKGYKDGMNYTGDQIEQLMYGLTEKVGDEVKLIKKADFNNIYRIESYMFSYMDLQKRWVNKIYKGGWDVEELNETPKRVCTIMGGRRKRTRRRRKKNRKKRTKKKARRKRRRKSSKRRRRRKR